jgi:hypothetical protein
MKMILLRMRVGCMRLMGVPEPPDAAVPLIAGNTRHELKVKICHSKIHLIRP